MPITKIHQCERCAHKWEEGTETEDSADKQFWTVGLVVSHSYDPEMRHGTRKVTAYWCRRCVERFGLVPNMTEGVEPIPEQPTVETLVREIVREELEAQE